MRMRMVGTLWCRTHTVTLPVNNTKLQYLRTIDTSILTEEHTRKTEWMACVPLIPRTTMDDALWWITDEECAILVRVNGMECDNNTQSQSTPFPYSIIFVASFPIFELHLKNEISLSRILLCNVRSARCLPSWYDFQSIHYLTYALFNRVNRHRTI